MRRAIPALLALALALTGCQSTTQTVSSPVTAATSAAPPDTPTPTPSVAMTAGFKVSDVQEAEKVYREFYAAFLATERSGGASVLPSSLARLVEKPASYNIEALLRSDHEDGIRLASEENGKLTMAPAEGHARDGSVVALLACADGRRLHYVRRDGASTTGRITVNYIYFHRNDRGGLTIFETTSTRNPSPCSP